MKKIVTNFISLYFLISLIVFFSQNTGAYFTDSGNTTSNDFSAVCWANPSSTRLTSPIDNTGTNATNVTFDWVTTTTSCPIATITYNFQIYSDVGLVTLVIESGFVSNITYTFSNVPEGEYWWKVQAKDQYGNQSNSVARHLVIDRTLPSETSLSITGSYTKAVDEKITNGDFSTGDLTGWTIAGNVQVLSSDTVNVPSNVITSLNSTQMVRIGDTENPGNMIWENRLMQSFATGAKSLSVHYNFFSRESAGFDEPGFFIRLNGQEIFRKNNLDSDGTIALDSGWSDYYYDLSNQTGSSSNLSLYAGNTGDNFGQSWVYIDKITTYFVTAPEHAAYSLSGLDNLGGSGIDYYEYRIDGGVPAIYSGPFGGVGSSLAVNGSHTIQYYSIDKAGNNGPIKTVSIMTDVTAPSTISDLSVSSIGINTAVLTWTAPGNDGSSGKAASYDIRYSTTNITNDMDFDASTKIEKVPTPQTAGITETLEILGLNPSTTYYFAIKSSDEAPNTSALSNIVSGTTLVGSNVNSGDIIINELMWMGSSISTADEWVELRNMTDHEINLSDYKLQKYDGSSYVDMITIPTTIPAKTIPAHGYFLVSNYAPGSVNTALKVGIIVDTSLVVDTAVELSNTALQLQLTDSSDNPLDVAWKYTENVTEGLSDTLNNYFYSMERASVPSDGSDPKYLTWYTCIDTASHNDFFTTEGSSDERGTPGSVNRSENEPLSHQLLLSRPTPILTIAVQATPSATPSLTLLQSTVSLNTSDDKKTVSFSVNNISGYDKLSYELSYDAFSSVRGLIGSDVDISSTDKFEKNSLDLATCSGEVCTYDQDVKNLKLTVTLIDKDGKKTKLEKGP
ncbi:MAG: lamin tail domain-containing protein [Patescibacteria group bacterium]